VVVIDPWVDQNPACPQRLKAFDRLDAMLVTHGTSTTSRTPSRSV